MLAALPHSFVEPCPATPRRIDVGRLTMNAVSAGTGRPAVFIHGLGWDHTLWGRQIDRLSDRYRVVAGDTRGHGGSDKPAGPYTVADFTADWAALLDSLDVSDALIVGFSLGGMIAQSLAVDRPDLVGALVLVNTTCRSPAVGRDHMQQRMAAARSDGPAAGALLAARSVFSPSWIDANPENLAAFVEWRVGQDQAALGEVMRAVSDFDISDRVGAIRIPTMIVTALSDTLMPPAAQQPMAELISTAERVEIADSGHMVSIERAAAFDAALDGFLQRHWRPLGSR